MDMLGIWIAAFGAGVVIGIIFEAITWDEEKELEKLRFEKSKKNIKY